MRGRRVFEELTIAIIMVALGGGLLGGIVIAHGLFNGTNIEWKVVVYLASIGGILGFVEYIRSMPRRRN